MVRLVVAIFLLFIATSVVSRFLVGTLNRSQMDLETRWLAATQRSPVLVPEGTRDFQTRQVECAQKQLALVVDAHSQHRLAFGFDAE